MKACDTYFRLALVAVLMLFAYLQPVRAGSPSLAVSKVASIEGSSSFALSSSGNLYGWGADNYGQLGQGQMLNSSTALLVGGNFKTVSVSPHTNRVSIAAIQVDNSLWTWGANAYGQLGDGTNVAKTKPIRVGSDFKAVVAASAFMLGIKLDGSLWMWGQGWFGSGAYSGSYVPKQIGSNFASVSSAGDHILALKLDGTLWSWGANRNGQLGYASTDICNPNTNSTYACSLTMLQVGSGFTAIAAGASSSFAIKADGSLWAWGANDYGQLGDGTKLQRNIPVMVATNVAAVSAGMYQSLVLKTDGSVWSWTNVPTKIGDGFTSIGVDIYGWGSFALKTDASLWAWGDNRNGIYGDGTTQTTYQPKKIANGVTAFSVNDYNSSFIKSDGTLWMAGDNSSGQLGVGAVTRRSNPVLIGAGFADIAFGGVAATLAVKTDGSLWAWGNGQFGNGLFGDGSSRNSAVPVRVGAEGGFRSVSVGMYHQLALKADGSLWGWGSNYRGELGLGTTVRSLAQPTAIGAGYIAMAASPSSHTVALKSDGSLWTWGHNGSGQLGVTTTELCGDTSFPTSVFSCATLPKMVGTGFRAVSAGSNHTMGLKTDGTLWAWGDNSAGQLGVTATDICKEGSNYTGANFNNMPCSMSPKLVGQNFASVSAGSQHTLAIKTDGTLWAWGTNYWGYLGDGQTTSSITAPKMVGSGFVRVEAGGYISLAIKADGTVWAWGMNNGGSLGNGTFANSTTPTLAINDTANGPLDLIPEIPNSIPADKQPSFFLVASGGITSTSATVNTATKFNPIDIGKSGAVYVTARVPAGSPLTASGPGPVMARAAQPGAAATTPVTPPLLIQLTPTGWQPVTNGQLIPYASGVFGDQLAAQTILNGTDTTNLKGAEFCVGYGTSAAEMNTAGRVRAVATIPDASGTSLSCMPVVLAQGWNLLGNGLNQSIPVASQYGDASWVNAVWKWDGANKQWHFYSPAMDASSLQSFATNKQYAVLSTLQPGDGYWVNASANASVLPPSGSAFTLNAAGLAVGWSLNATGVPTAPSTFGTSASAASITSLWSWDAPSQNWFFYAPSLDVQGSTALTDYITSQGYKDFTAAGKTLGPNVGFWVNRP